MAVNFIRMDSPAKGGLRGIKFQTNAVPWESLEAEEDQDGKVLLDRVCGSVWNGHSLFAVSEILLWEGLRESRPFSSIPYFPFALTRCKSLAKKLFKPSQ